jgi:hypothetical protein
MVQRAVLPSGDPEPPSVSLRNRRNAATRRAGISALAYLPGAGF